MEDQHKKFMTEAIKLSEESAKSGGGPFGCVIVKDGQIIGRGTNQVTAKNDPTAHGEIVAIRDACKKLNSFQLQDCIIYTSTEPCPMCLGAIYWARPKAVYFGNTKEDAAAINFDDAHIYTELNKPHNQKQIPFQQIMATEAKSAFTIWGENPHKIKY